MIYKSRGLKRRRNTDKWEVTLAHKDPMTGEVELSYHTVEATTRKKAEKERDRLIQDLQGKGSACTSQMTIKDFLDEFIQYKEDSGRIEPSTINHYRKQAKVVCRYLGGERLADVGIPRVNGWMAQMVSEGYAPRTVQKPFALLRQAMKYAVALDLITKNPCDFCKLNGFEITFHDLRHTFATMMIAGGTDVRTVASYLGHSNVAMTLNTYAEVDPDAKLAAFDKIGEAFDIDLDGVFAKEAERPALGFSFTIEQLEFMLAEAKRRKEGGDDGFEAILVPAC